MGKGKEKRTQKRIKEGGGKGGAFNYLNSMRLLAAVSGGSVRGSWNSAADWARRIFLFFRR